VPDFNTLFDSLNASVLGVFGTPVTYRPSTGATTQGNSYPVTAILETPRIEDTQLDATYLIFWVDGNDPALPTLPVKGDRFQLADGTLYSVHDIDVDAANGFACACRKLSR
jgi:hypothetical protein